jgi:uncharacterized protein YjbI with pentapeptide repeats
MYFDGAVVHRFFEEVLFGQTHQTTHLHAVHLRRWQDDRTDITPHHSTSHHNTSQHITTHHNTSHHTTHHNSQLSSAQLSSAQLRSAQLSSAQLSSAQHSTAQHSTAQHSTAASKPVRRWQWVGGGWHVACGIRTLVQYGMRWL